ncbi:hypothetical protein Tco_1417705 [Tanacetum coccineum]
MTDTQRRLIHESSYTVRIQNDEQKVDTETLPKDDKDQDPSSLRIDDIYLGTKLLIEKSPKGDYQSQKDKWGEENKIQLIHQVTDKVDLEEFDPQVLDQNLDSTLGSCLQQKYCQLPSIPCSYGSFDNRYVMMIEGLFSSDQTRVGSQKRRRSDSALLGQLNLHRIDDDQSSKKPREVGGICFPNKHPRSLPPRMADH